MDCPNSRVQGMKKYYLLEALAEKSWMLHIWVQLLTFSQPAQPKTLLTWTIELTLSIVTTKNIICVRFSQNTMILSCFSRTRFETSIIDQKHIENFFCCFFFICQDGDMNCLMQTSCSDSFTLVFHWCSHSAIFEKCLVDR